MVDDTTVRPFQHWRAGCDESRKSGSEGGCWKSARQRVTRWQPTLRAPSNGGLNPTLSVDRLGVMACGSPGLPEMSRKAKGTYSTPGKRLMGKAVYPMLRETRSVWSRLNCLNPSSQGVKTPQGIQRPKSPCRPYPSSSLARGTLQDGTACRRGMTRERMGDLTGPITFNSHGIRDRLRGASPMVTEAP
jgi:hypothetical protein